MKAIALLVSYRSLFYILCILLCSLNFCPNLYSAAIPPLDCCDVVCQDATLYLDDNGEAVIEPSLIIGSNFNCNSVSVALSDTFVSCLKPSLVVAFGNYYSIDLNSQTTTFLGNIQSSFFCNNNSMAVDNSTGRAFAMDGYQCGNFFEFNPFNGDFIQNFNILQNFTGLEFVNGLLYGSDSYSGSLYEININTGVSTLVGNHNINNNSGWMNGLAYDASTGILYGVLGASFPDSLYSIDINTGAATLIGSTGTDLKSISIGPDGYLYGAASNDLFILDKATGTATYLFNIPSNGNGMMLLNIPDTSSSITVTVTVSDASGDIDSCEAVITLLDTIKPEADCDDVTVSIFSTAAKAALLVNGASSDNCFIDTMYVDIEPLDCSDYGDTAIATLTVIDFQGNTDTCHASVIFGPPDTLSWNGDVSTDWATNGNWHPCGIPGPNTVCIIPDVSDSSGNFPLVSTPLETAKEVIIRDDSKLEIANTGGLTIANSAEDGVWLEGNSSLLNNGELTINNAAVEGIGANDSPLNSIINNGNLLIYNVGSDGIISDGYVENNGNITMDIIGDEAMEIDGSLINNLNATITITNADNGETFENDGTIENFGSITVDVIFSDNILENDGQFINHESGVVIFLNSIDDEAIGNDGRFENYGFIQIDSTDGSGIENDEVFINGPTGNILISNSGDDGIDNFADIFDNQGNIEILINDNIGLYHGGGKFLNSGSISIKRDTADTTPFDSEALDNNDEFINTGLLFIDVGGGVGIYNDETIRNLLCGVIDIRQDTIINNDSIINDALIIAGPNTVVINNGVIINNGDILDPFGAFSVGGVINNGNISDSADTSNYTVDADGDGYIICEDCNDMDPLVNPGAPEVCNNGIDDDCDGLIDEDPGAISANADTVICPGDSIILKLDLENAPYTVFQEDSLFAPLPVGVGDSVFVDDDEVSDGLPIGFDFEFFGNSYDTFYVSSNGFITFSDNQDNGCCSGDAIPNTSEPNNYIAVAWTDLDPGDGPQGDFEFYTTGVAPNRILVAAFLDYATNDEDLVPQLTSQILLYEGSNNIEIHTTYQSIFSEDDIVMGIENEDGTEGFAVPGRNQTIWNATNDFVSFVSDCQFSGWSNDKDTVVIDSVCAKVGPTTTTTYFASSICGEDPCPVVVYVPNADTLKSVDSSDTDCIFVDCDDALVCVSANPSTVNHLLGYDIILLDSEDSIIALYLDTTEICIDFDSLISVDTEFRILGLAYSVEDDYLAALPQTLGELINLMNCFDLGDGAGQFITVKVTPPTAVCKDINVYLDSNGMAGISPMMIDDGSYSACGIDTMILIGNTDYDCNSSSETVQLVVIDSIGLSDTCTAVVTVLATIDPVALCADSFSVILNSQKVVKLPPALFNSGSYDNCSALALSTDKFLFDCDDIGYNTVTLTVTNDAGTSDSCTTVVEIVELTKPTALCKAQLVAYANENGEVIITPELVNNGSSDNCDTVMYSFDINVLTCGSNTVTMTVTDRSGNSSSCASTIFLIDTIGPNVVCNDIDLNLQASGYNTITLNDVEVLSSDACGIVSKELSQKVYSCSNLGINLETLTVTDVNGNTTECEYEVTVYDPLGACAPTCATAMNLTSTNISYASATLSWNSVPGAVSYIVSGNKISGPTVSIASADTSLDVTGLKQDTDYEWRVLAVCASNNLSGVSATDFFSTLICPAPVNLSVTAGPPVSALLEWDEVPQALGYRIRGGKLGKNPVSVEFSGGSNNTYFADNLAANSDYYWVVESVCSFSPKVRSDISEIDSFSTGGSASELKTDMPAASLKVNLYPNPNDGQFIIDLYVDHEEFTVEVFDLLGKNLKTQNYSGRTVNMTLGAEAAGTYLIKITSAGEQVIKRVVIN